ncbi:hypothetical protein evm_001697 [Chilo suppressalis]|nr:hypothetical protein evm_001697 [Chilo suppressalis]
MDITKVKDAKQQRRKQSKMLKYLSLGAIVIAFASAAIYDMNELDNVVEFGPSHLPGVSLPYAYRGNRIELVRPEPYHKGRYEPVMLPVVAAPVKDVAVVKPGLVSSIASFAISVVGTAIKFLFKNALALAVGSLVVIGVCNLTPVCSKLSQIDSLSEASRDISSFATPERIIRATEFVRDAVRKYRSYQ